MALLLSNKKKCRLWSAVVILQMGIDGSSQTRMTWISVLVQVGLYTRTACSWKMASVSLAVALVSFQCYPSSKELRAMTRLSLSPHPPRPYHLIIITTQRERESAAWDFFCWTGGDRQSEVDLFFIEWGSASKIVCKGDPQVLPPGCWLFIFFKLHGLLFGLMPAVLRGC